MTEDYPLENGMRIIQETVPGRQVTLAHIIASPDPILDYDKAAIGISTVTPSETAVIMADIAMKSSGAQIGFVDRFSGTLIFTGTVSEVETAMDAMLTYVSEKLNHTVCEITKT